MVFDVLGVSAITPTPPRFNLALSVILTDQDRVGLKETNVKQLSNHCGA
jgi:hypothetical protein